MLESILMVPLLRLASNSPRRKQLLALTGIPFSVCPADIDESALPGELPAEYVLRLAINKAHTAALAVQQEGQSSQGVLILAADTTVADGSRILGKPAGALEAEEMLLSLRGRDHFVYTAICVVDPVDGRQEAELSATRVWMRDYTNEEIASYIASGDPFDKAGAYAIQNADFHPVERIEGCFATVMGLPVCQVVRTLQAFGVRPSRSVSAACQEFLELGQPCLVYQQVLAGQNDQ